eukprot:1185754-Prorocentrum_minimum.AAC.3
MHVDRVRCTGLIHTQYLRWRCIRIPQTAHKNGEHQDQRKKRDVHNGYRYILKSIYHLTQIGMIARPFLFVQLANGVYAIVCVPHDIVKLTPIGTGGLGVLLMFKKLVNHIARYNTWLNKLEKELKTLKVCQRI